MPDYIIKSDAKQTSTLGKVKVLVEQVVGSPSQEAINTAVANYIESHPGSLSPLSPAVKAALLQIAEKVAYIDEHGEDYYDALDAALNAIAVLQITAVFTQGSAVIYDTDTLDSLKQYLVVTAYYDDGTSADVTNLCTLSGSMAEGTNTITVTYEDKTTTFQVTTVQKILYTLSASDFAILSAAYNYSTSNGYPSKTPYPYTSKTDTRLTYIGGNGFNLLLPGGKTYKTILESTEPTAQITVAYITQAGLDKVAANQSLTSAMSYEQGWQDVAGEYLITVPETYNGSPIAACRPICRLNSSNGTISSNFITSVTIREMPTE